MERSDLNAVTFAFGLEDALRLLGVEIWNLPNGVHALPLRLERGRFLVDFVSTSGSFKVGPMESLKVHDGAPIPWWSPEREVQG